MFKTFLKNKRGNIAVSFALASVALVGIGGGITEYASQTASVSHLQGVADAAVLVAANELKLSGSKAMHESSLKAVASAYVKHNIDKDLGTPSTSLKLTPADKMVDLDLSATVKTPFLSLLGLNSDQRIKVSARAQIFGGLPLCILSLDEDISYSIRATNSAKVTATGCTVHSNSIKTNAIEVWGQALLKTGLTCSAGGAEGGAGNYIPVALTDCPAIPDPLMGRQPPNMGSGTVSAACTRTNLQLSSGSHTLRPGRYCGGIKITGSAHVEFEEGIYIIDSGQFEITGNAEVRGNYVGFGFTGPNAQFKFQGQADVELYAPKDGVMAGLLFYERPNRPEYPLHEINSPNVEKLVGTVYLPKSELRISVNGSGNNAVAEGSEFTVIVAGQITLNGKTNLVLNTDFAATDVPVPSSIAALSGQVVISK